MNTKAIKQRVLGTHDIRACYNQRSLLMLTGKPETDALLLVQVAVAKRKWFVELF